MANDIGTIKETRGFSTELNGQKGSGAMKPATSGKENPGGTKPPKAPEGSASPIAK